MSEVGNKYLGTLKLFPCLTFVYKDTEDCFLGQGLTGEHSCYRIDCGTVIEISKITPKQVVAKFYRYKDNNYLIRREETTQPGCRYMVKLGLGGAEPFIFLKKSAAMWDNPILERLTHNHIPFYLDDLHLKKMEGGEPLVENQNK